MLGSVKARSPWMCGPSHNAITKGRPMVGIARAALAIAMTSRPPRPVWPAHKPTGIPIAAAMSSTIRL